MRDFFLSIPELQSRIGSPTAPLIVDVRRRPLFDDTAAIIPTARWRDHNAADIWGQRLPQGVEIVVHCVHGHNVSQAAAATLRSHGINACVLEGGIEGWKDAGGPIIHKTAIPHRDEDVSSVWVIPLEHHTEYAAVAWLTRRFLDSGAEFRFVEAEHVAAVAEELGAIALGVPDTTFAPNDTEAPFDAVLRSVGLVDAGLTTLAGFVREARVADREDGPETLDLSAILNGAAVFSGQEPHATLERILPIFDAAYANLRTQGHAAS